MDRATYLEAFKKTTEMMYSITDAKNQDYGGKDDAWKNFRTFGIKGILVRMSDKFARLHTGIWEERTFKVPETLKDTILDLAVYAVILYIWIDREEK